MINMKKVISFILVIIFCFQSSGFAVAIEKEKNIPSLQDDNNINAFENNFQTNSDGNFISQKLSPIERVFNGKENETSGKMLLQVGYDMFTGINPLAGNSAGKIDNSYKLSIGEKVTVYLYGDSVDVMAISGTNLLNPMTKTEVDSKGNIFIQGVGMFKAENKSLHELEEEANSVAQKKYQNLKVRLTIASGQESAGCSCSTSHTGL